VLAEKLLESVETEDPREVDAAGAEEAERRVKAFKEAAVEAIAGDEVFRSLERGEDR